MAKRINKIDSAQFDGPDTAGDGATATGGLTLYDIAEMADLYKELNVDRQQPVSTLTHAIKQLHLARVNHLQQIADANKLILQQARMLADSQEREEELRKLLGEHREVVNEVRRGVRPTPAPAANFGVSPGSVCNRTHSGATPLAVTCVGIITEFHGPAGWRTPTCRTCGWTGEGRRVHGLQGPY